MQPQRLVTLIVRSALLCILAVLLSASSCLDTGDSSDSPTAPTTTAPTGGAGAGGGGGVQADTARIVFRNGETFTVELNSLRWRYAFGLSTSTAAEVSWRWQSNCSSSRVSIVQDIAYARPIRFAGARGTEPPCGGGDYVWELRVPSQGRFEQAASSVSGVYYTRLNGTRESASFSSIREIIIP